MQRIVTKRERIVFFATIGVIAFAIIFKVFILPVLDNNDALNNRINLSRAKLRKYKLLLAQKERIEKKYARLSSGVPAVGQKDDMQVSALTELESLSKNASVHILDIRPQPVQNLASYNEIIIDLRTEGTVEGYLNFIYNLENSISLLRVTRFQLTAKPNSPLLEGTFSISKLSAIQ